MHLITSKRIREAKEKHKNLINALDAWLKLIEKNQFKSFIELKHTFNSVDKVGNFYVFNVGGNKIRIITTIHFNRSKVFIRHILTHKEYDKNKWKQEGNCHE